MASGRPLHYSLGFALALLVLLTGALHPATGRWRTAASNVTVSPDNDSQSRPEYSTGTFEFIVYNDGPDTGNFDLTCQRDGVYVTSCTVLGTNPVSIPGDLLPVNVTVRYTTSGVGTGWVQLTADDGSSQDVGSANISVYAAPAAALVEPKAQVDTVYEGQSSYASTFRVKNRGSLAGDYLYSCTDVFNGQIACSLSHTSATIAAGAEDTVSVSFPWSGGGGFLVDDIYLNAFHPNGSDNATHSIYIRPQWGVPVITPMPTKLTYDVNEAGNSKQADFHIQNPGIGSGTYTISCEDLSGIVGNCTPEIGGSSVTSVTLAASETKVAVAAFTVPNQTGTYYVKFRADYGTSGEVRDSVEVEVLPSYTPPTSSGDADVRAIAPVAGVLYVARNTSATASFSVTSGVPGPIDYTMSCADDGTLITSCGPTSPTILEDMLDFDQDTVDVPFQAGGTTGMTGLVRLHAVAGSSDNFGDYTVYVYPPPDVEPVVTGFVFPAAALSDEPTFEFINNGGQWTL